MPPSYRARENRSSHRPRLYDTQAMARNIRETFVSKPVRHEKELGFGWPSTLQYVGKNIGVGYASDKWKEDGDFELYLHLAESPNRALCTPGFLVRYDNPGEAVPVSGPMIQLASIPMPKHFAVLAHFEEVRVHLFAPKCDPKAPRLGPVSTSIHRVQMPGAMLGASVIPWSKVDDTREDQPFLFVYTEGKGRTPGGAHMLIVGEELAVEKDGIVG